MPQGALSTCCTEWPSQRGWLSHRNHIGTIRNGQMQTVVLCRIRHANQRRWKNKSLRIMQTRRVVWCFLGNLEVNPLVDGPMITFKILVVSQLDPCPLKHNWVMLKLVVGDTFCPAHIWTLFQGPKSLLDLVFCIGTWSWNAPRWLVAVWCLATEAGGREDEGHNLMAETLRVHSCWNHILAPSRRWYKTCGANGKIPFFWVASHSFLRQGKLFRFEAPPNFWRTSTVGHRSQWWSSKMG